MDKKTLIPTYILIFIFNATGFVTLFFVNWKIGLGVLLIMWGHHMATYVERILNNNKKEKDCVG